MHILNFLKHYSFLIDLLIAVVGMLYGGIYLHGTLKRRSEAKYGFYINFLLFIRRLRIFISKNIDITQLLAKADTRLRSYVPSDEIIKGFRKLSEEFLSFLDSSKDIIPPYKSEKESWYKNLLIIVRFFQWGAMADDLHLIIDDKTDADKEIECESKSILDALTWTEHILYKAIGFSNGNEKKAFVRNGERDRERDPAD